MNYVSTVWGSMTWENFKLKSWGPDAWSRRPPAEGSREQPLAWAYSFGSGPDRRGTPVQGSQRRGGKTGQG